jgi:hypothetical protein
MICHYAQYHILFIVMLNVVMFCVNILGVIILNVGMLNVAMFSVNMLSVIILNVGMLNVVMLSVDAPVQTLLLTLAHRQ